MKKLPFALLLWLSLLVPGRSVDLSAIIKETQVSQMGSNEFIMIWWMGASYWELALSENKDMTLQQKQNLVEVFDKQLIVAIVAADFDSLGRITAISKDAVVNSLSCKFNGKKLRLLTDQEVEDRCGALLAQLKPAMASSLGKFGSAMEFYAFEKPEVSGRVERESGYIDVLANGKNARFRLPLGSLLPPKTDKETGDSFPGNYLYNPYTGKELK